MKGININDASPLKLPDMSGPVKMSYLEDEEVKIDNIDCRRHFTEFSKWGLSSRREANE